MVEEEEEEEEGAQMDGATGEAYERDENDQEMDVEPRLNGS